MLIPPTAALAGVGYMSYLAFCPEGRPKPSNRCNNAVRLGEQKVVDAVDIEDIAEKAAFCRCWKSKNVGFPPSLACIYCSSIFDNHSAFGYSGRIVMVPTEHIIKKPVITLAQLSSNVKLKVNLCKRACF